MGEQERPFPARTSAALCDKKNVLGSAGTDQLLRNHHVRIFRLAGWNSPTVGGMKVMLRGREAGSGNIAAGNGNAQNSFYIHQVRLVRGKGKIGKPTARAQLSAPGLIKVGGMALAVPPLVSVSALRD